MFTEQIDHESELFHCQKTTRILTEPFSVKPHSHLANMHGARDKNELHKLNHECMLVRVVITQLYLDYGYTVMHDYL